MKRMALMLVLALTAAMAQDWTDADVETDADRVPKTRTGGNGYISNATIITVGPQGTLKGSILVRNGKIAAIGDVKKPDGVVEIDGTGLYAMPGIVDCHSHIANEGGLNESSESITPEVRVLDVLQPNDVSIYRAVAGGCTSANILHGSANVIGGQNATIKMRWGSRNLVFENAPRGVKFALGENPKRSNFPQGRGQRFPNTRMGVEATLRRAFTEAKEYMAAKEKGGATFRKDERLEALAGILRGDILVHCHCYRYDEILALLDVAKEFGFKIQTLQHVLEGYRAAIEIAQHGAGPSTFSDWWAFKYEAFDATPYNAALMAQAGCTVSLHSDSAELMRHLYIEAAKAVKYGGVDPIEALKMVTLNPAKQLAIDKWVGSLEVGKDADIALFNGHPLSPYSRCVMTLIDGEVYFEKRDVPNHATADFDPNKRLRRGPLTLSDKGSYAITNARIVTVSGETIEKGTIAIKNGKIVSLSDIPPDAQVIDGTGLSVYPGLIDTGTEIGLTEVGSVAGTVDTAEIGGYQPDLVVSKAINPTSEIIPVTRANGLTTVLTAPRGGPVCGQSAVIHLGGWQPKDLVKVSAWALHINVPRVKRPDEGEPTQGPGRGGQQQAPSDEDKAWKELREFFAAAKRYMAAHDTPDQKFEAMIPYLKGERPVVFHANEPDQIRWSIKFAEEHGLKPVIAGGREAWKVASLLKEKSVPVLLGPIFQLPGDRTDPYDAGYTVAARLHRAGVKFAIRSADATNARNLPYHAAMAAAHGLPREEALKAITLYPAQILGIDGRVGSLEVGKDADVIVTTGDPLEVITDVCAVFVQGKPCSLETKHTRLYEQWKKYLDERLRNGK